MKATDIPIKFPQAFGYQAATGTIRAIPVASQDQTQPATRGAASLADGFPTPTGQALASGGVPPAMQDFNGLLFQSTGWNRWQAAAGLAPWDSVFNTAIGGYPQGATVLSATTSGRIWISTADNNTTNPDANTAANWLPLMLRSDVLPYTIAGSKKASAFTAGTTLNDISPLNTDVPVQTITITGATYCDVRAGCNVTNPNAAGARITIRINLSPLPAGENNNTYAGLINFNGQITPISLTAGYQNMDPAQTYTIQLTARKADNVGATGVGDGNLVVYHNGQRLS